MYPCPQVSAQLVTIPDGVGAVAERNLTHGPWDTSAQVEDMQLTGDLRAMRYSANVSVSARAYAGPMLTVVTGPCVAVPTEVRLYWPCS